jgi:hypothetical protein
VSDLTIEVQRSGVHDLIVILRRLGTGYFYWRVSIGGGVLSRPERGQAVFEV